MGETKEDNKRAGRWTGQSKGNKLGYSIFIKVLQVLGVGPAYFLLRFVAAYYFLFSRKSNKNILYLLQERLGYKDFASYKNLYHNYYWFGQALIDRIVMMSSIKNKFTFNFDDEVHFNKMIALGRGGLLLSAHLGNWEIAGHLLEKRMNTRINIVMYDNEHQKLKQYLERVTGQRNANIIVIKENLSHIYEITEALGNNEFVCMHADRFLPGNKTLQADFLAEKATFPAGPFVLAAKLDVPVSFVFAMKETHRHYHFYATAGNVYRNSDKGTPDQVLAEFIATLEEKVKQYPAQWFNYFPFWETEANNRPN